MEKKLGKYPFLAELFKQYPEYHCKIEGMLKENPDFKKMCEDYEVVAERLDFWRKLEKQSSSESPDKQIEKQILEDSELLKELKLEILLAIKQEDL